MAYTAWSVVFGEQPSASKWNQLGTNDAEFNSLIQRNGTGLNILDSSGNELIKGTAVVSAVNEVTAANAATGNYPSLSATGGDTNIDINIAPKGTGVLRTGGYPEWWQEIGRTTLGSAGDTISVASLPVRQHIMIWFYCIGSGQLNNLLRFNNDSGANYAERFYSDGVVSANVSQTGINLESGTTTARTAGYASVINIAAREKEIFLLSNASANGAANAPTHTQAMAKWANTADAITRIDLVNTGTGDFASGSYLVVLGHD